MKRLSAKQQKVQRARILSAAERTRQACNRLSEEEMRQLHEKALALINGQDAKARAGRR